MYVFPLYVTVSPVLYATPVAQADIPGLDVAVEVGTTVGATVADGAGVGTTVGATVTAGVAVGATVAVVDVQILMNFHTPFVPLRSGRSPCAHHLAS